jgi:hypothetical protein
MTRPLSNSANHALEVCCELEDHLLIDLHEILSERRAGRSDAALPVLLRALQENLERQLGLKENRVFIPSSNATDSSLFREIDILTLEGKSCHPELTRLRVHLASELAVAALSATSREELAGWARSLVAYRRHEKRVLQSQHNQEDGGEA